MNRNPDRRQPSTVLGTVKDALRAPLARRPPGIPDRPCARRFPDHRSGRRDGLPVEQRGRRLTPLQPPNLKQERAVN